MVSQDRHQNTRENLLRLVQEHLFDLGRPLRADEDLFEAGLESMGIMQLIIQMESQLGIVVGDGDITRANFTSVETLATMLESSRYSKK